MTRSYTHTILHLSLFACTLTTPTWAQDFKFDLNSLSKELGRPVTDADLEAMAEKGRTGEQTYDITINGEDKTTQKVVIEKVGNNYVAHFPMSILLSANLKKDILAKLEKEPANSTFSDPSIYLPGSKVVLDTDMMTADITIPQAWLFEKHRELANHTLWNYGIPALKLNYLVDYSETHGTDTSTRRGYGSLDSQLNLGPWRLVNRSIATFDNYDGSQRWDMESQMTYLTRILPEWSARLTLGSIITQSMFSDSLQILGVELRDNSDQHEAFEQAYLPAITGVAETRSVVTIRQNGRTILVKEVPAGPFSFEDVDGIGYGGTVEVNVRGANGVERTFYVPFMTGLRQLRPGSWSWDIGAGRLDEIETDHAPLVKGSVGYGLPAGFTLFGSTTLSDQYQYYQAGIAADLGWAGALSLSVDHSDSSYEQHNQSGQTAELMWRHQVDATKSQISLSYTKTIAGKPISFANAARDTSANRIYLDSAKREDRLALTLSQPLFLWSSSTLNASYVWDKYTDGHTRQSLTGWLSFPFWYGGYWQISVQHSKNTSGTVITAADNDTMVTVNLTLPLDPISSFTKNATLTASGLYSNHQWSKEARFNGYIDDDYHWNYWLSAQQDGNRENTYSGGVAYDGPRIQANASLSHSEWADALNLSANGGILATKHGVMFARDFSGSQAVVSVPHTKELKVQNYPNNPNWTGDKVLISGLNDYRKNEVRLDPDSVPSNVTVAAFVDTAIPADGAVLDLSFASYAGIQSLFTVHQDNGQPLPFGATVSIQSEDGAQVPDTVSDETGRVYLGSAPAKGTLSAHWTENGQAYRCTVQYQIPDEEEAKQSGIYRQNLVCRAAKE